MYQSKAEMETTKQNYQSRIEKLKAELENQVKHVKMLENQLKSLSANSNSDFFGDFSVSLVGVDKIQASDLTGNNAHRNSSS